VDSVGLSDLCFRVKTSKLWLEIIILILVIRSSSVLIFRCQTSCRLYVF